MDEKDNHDAGNVFAIFYWHTISVSVFAGFLALAMAASEES